MLQIHFNIIFPSVHTFPTWPLLFKVSSWYYLYIPNPSHSVYMYRSSRPSRFDHAYSYYIRRRAQLMKLLIVQFSLFQWRPSSQVQIFFSSPCSQPPSIYRYALETKLHTHPKQEVTSWNCRFCFWVSSSKGHLMGLLVSLSVTSVSRTSRYVIHRCPYLLQFRSYNN